MKTIYLWMGTGAALIGTEHFYINPSFELFHGAVKLGQADSLEDCQHFLKELIRYWHRSECCDAIKYGEQFPNSTFNLDI